MRSSEHEFLRVRCDTCHFERLVAFSCKKRGFCPSCGARRTAETAALLSDEVFPDVPLRQWVISFPFPLRYLFAAHPQAMGKVLGIILPRNFYTSDPQSWIPAQGRGDWCSDTDPAVVGKFSSSLNLLPEKKGRSLPSVGPFFYLIR